MNGAFGWWERNTPQSLKNYGPPVLSNGAVNHEMLAAGLGELPFSLVYSGEDENFWYRDYAVEGHCKTSSGKVEILYKNLILKASEELLLPVRNTLLGLRDHSKKVIQAAKVILEVEPSYWDTHERVINGVREEFTPRESCRHFAQEAITQQEGQSLALREAFTAYTRYCSTHNVLPLARPEFQREFVTELKLKYGAKMRNDLPNGEKVTRGWSKLGIREQFLPISE
jgi:hypothetical protein